MSTNNMKRSILLLFSLSLIFQTSANILAGFEGSCCNDDSVFVNGEGKVSYKPDIAIVNIGVSVTAKTSQKATQGAAEKINQIQEILAKNNIQKADIQTQSISIYPQYDYPEGKQTLVGQSAQQTLEVTVRKINPNGGILGSLIDQLVAVDGIQFNGLRFDKVNKTEAEKQARKLAFENAKKKATDYAVLSERTLGKVLTIVDNAGSSAPPVFAQALTFAAAKSDTSVSVGLLQTSYSIQVKFAFR